MMPKKIILDSDTKIDVLDIGEITHITVDSVCVKIHLLNGANYHSNETLSSFETSLPSDMFCRINRNTIVNISYIVNINKLTRKLIIEGNIVLCVSARQLKNLTKRLKPNLIRSSRNSIRSQKNS